MWIKSSRCDSGACLEAAFQAEVLVRDSKAGEAGPVLRFSTTDWVTFLNELPERVRS